MKYLVVGLTAAGAIAAGIASYVSPDEAPAIKKAAVTSPSLQAPVLQAPEEGLREEIEISSLAPDIVVPEITDLPVRITDLPPPRVIVDWPATAAEIHPKPWKREIASGETLGFILQEAGLPSGDRVEAIQALGEEFDMRRLRPGHEVVVELTDEGQPSRVALNVAGGKQIEARLGDTTWLTHVIVEEPEVVTLAKEATVAGSVSATLSKAGVPTRFAVDLVNALGGKVNFRRELRGGETLKLLWEESRIKTGRVGQPSLSFVSLDLRGDVYEAVWEDGSSPMVFENGEITRTFAKPVSNARLSSKFGNRKHPIFGNMRLHAGIDFAAPTGTRVHATAPGRVSFTGRRGGYGIVVEISHGSGTMTRYAHLSRVEKGIKKGSRVQAGDTIARVGSTGNSTGPHLHYEVRVNGKPTDPLKDKRLAEAVRKGDMDVEARAKLAQAREAVSKKLSTEMAAAAPAN